MEREDVTLLSQVSILFICSAVFNIFNWYSAISFSISNRSSFFFPSRIIWALCVSKLESTVSSLIVAKSLTLFFFASSGFVSLQAFAMNPNKATFTISASSAYAIHCFIISLRQNIVFYCICLNQIITFTKKTFYIPFCLFGIIFFFLQALEFLYQI